MTANQQLFEGIKILDLTRVYSGPLATRLLADYGAEVIKIETKKNPDPTRNYPPIKEGWSGYFEILNRNKKSLFLDLKTKSDLDRFYQLVKTADVIVENLQPKTKNKLKVDYQTLKKINSKIIYASLAGLDQKSNIGYYDLIAQAQSGLMSLTGIGQPTKVGPAIVDAASGFNLAFAISSALFYREKTGLGQNLSVSMLATAMNMIEQNLIEYSVKNKNPNLPGNQDTAIAPFGIYKTRDGYIAVAAGSNAIWKRLLQFLEEIQRTETKLFETNQKRLKNQQKLTKYLEKCFQSFSTKELAKKLLNIRVPASPVAKMSDVSENSWLREHHAIIEINHPKLGICLVPGYSINFGIGVLAPIEPIK